MRQPPSPPTQSFERSGSGPVTEEEQRRVRQRLQHYCVPSMTAAFRQLLVTLLLFGAFWVGALFVSEWSVWGALLCSAAAGALVLRVFIIQHDCGHGSFFPSRRLNDALGLLLSVLTLAPYFYWRRTHAIHHKNTCRLETRGLLGYIDLRTVREYQALSSKQQLWYRVYRNPWFLLLFGVPFQYVCWHRVPLDVPRGWRKEWGSVAFCNGGLALVLLLANKTIGLERFFLIQMPVTFIACFLGGWLFYVQHNFDTARWAGEGEWTFSDSALCGSSYLKLPDWAHWLTGHIGLHHVHHLVPRVPNYRLKMCLESSPLLRAVPGFTLSESFAFGRLSLWDEELGKMVPCPLPKASALLSRTS